MAKFLVARHKYGVPQGSLLGPRLFKMYVNDLPSYTKEGYLQIFADDTTAYVIGENIEEVIDGLNRIAADLHKWCQRNKMTVNTEKTEVMVIKAATFVGPLRPVLFGEKQLRVVTTAKCLGVTIDNNMTWKNHITKVSNQYNAKLSHLRRIRHLPRHILETIYSTMHHINCNKLYSGLGNVYTSDVSGDGEKAHKSSKADLQHTQHRIISRTSVATSELKIIRLHI